MDKKSESSICCADVIVSKEGEGGEESSVKYIPEILSCLLCELDLK
jgi:hypothetical protein